MSGRKMKYRYRMSIEEIRALSRKYDCGPTSDHQVEQCARQAEQFATEPTHLAFREHPLKEVDQIAVSYRMVHGLALMRDSLNGAELDEGEIHYD